MRSCVVAFTLLLSLSLDLPSLAIPRALSQDLGPWRALTAEEEKIRIGETPSSEADPSMIEGDFDGDKTKDKALIAVRRSDGIRGLVVLLKSQHHILVV
jgi:hypothetical protein